MSINYYWGFLVAAMLLGGQAARPDAIVFTGNLSSDGTAVGSGDPVITDPTTVNTGDPFSVTLSYDPAAFANSGSSYVLTDASVALKFDGYSFGYTSAAGNYIEFSTPGVWGPGTVSFLICSSAPGCSTDGYMTLYFTGTVSDLSTLALQASALSGDSSASPSEFEFLRNFDDGSQTDLQGSLAAPTSVSPVPEPSTMGMMALLAFGALTIRAMCAGARSKWQAVPTLCRLRRNSGNF